jgi:hypothetical protein
MKKILLIIFLFSSLFIYSQDSAEDETNYSSGNIVKITKDTITLKEYNFDSDTNIEVVYKISKDVELLGIESLNELLINDLIEIDYIIKNNSKIIILINKIYDDNDDTDIDTNDEDE